MPLSADQIKMMKDQELRKILPNARVNFSSFDSYFASFGSSCPRLDPPFRAVMKAVKENKAATAYIKSKHPTVVVAVPVAPTPTPAVAQVPAPPTMEEARRVAIVGGVARAIEFLESRKKKHV